MVSREGPPNLPRPRRGAAIQAMAPPDGKLAGCLDHDIRVMLEYPCYLSEFWFPTTPISEEGDGEEHELAYDRGEATFVGFPASTSFAYLALSSGVRRTATRAST